MIKLFSKNAYPRVETEMPITSALIARAALTLILCVSVTAEARLVRGGGSGARTIIESVVFAGTTPFLIADPADPNAVTGADLATAANYGFGPVGTQATIDHDWGRDCALYIECIFELANSEILDWQAPLVGLPPELSSGSYDAIADLVITWEFLAFNPPNPGEPVSTAGDPSRTLSADYQWSSTFSANSDGTYNPGVGDAAVVLGDSLGYMPSTDELSGCFARFPTLGAPLFAPHDLSVDEAYSYNDCRYIGLNLNLDPDQPTGADLLTELIEDEYLGLLVTTEFLVPDGFQFASFYADGTDLGFDALEPGANLTTAELLRGLNDINYAGCIGPIADQCQRFLASSQVLRFDVVDDVNRVPLPSSITLLTIGLGAMLRRRILVRIIRKYKKKLGQAVRGLRLRGAPIVEQ